MQTPAPTDPGTRTPSPWPRRLLLGVLSAGLMVGGSAGLALQDALARDPIRSNVGRSEQDDQRVRRRKAIRRACTWLASKQNDDGSFGDARVVIALTSLSVLALMSEGSMDGRGPYGAEVRRGINFLLKLVEQKDPASEWPKGYFEHAQDTTSRMHGHGFATLALASALGTHTSSRGTLRSLRKRDERIRAVLKEAVICCEVGQTLSGGYGYRPQRSANHEGSVTVCIAQGLRAARDAGLKIDRRVVANSLGYLRNSQKADGTFKYSLRQDTSSYPLTAAALSAFFLFGEYEDQEKPYIRSAIRALRRYLDRSVEYRWYYYGHFYAAWACWQRAGNDWSPGSSLWGYWQNRVYPHLLDKQTNDGSFEVISGRFENYGPVLTTAFAILTLAIPDEALPIFQR